MVEDEHWISVSIGPYRFSGTALASRAVGPSVDTQEPWTIAPGSTRVPRFSTFRTGASGNKCLLDLGSSHSRTLFSISAPYSNRTAPGCDWGSSNSVEPRAKLFHSFDGSWWDRSPEHHVVGGTPPPCAHRGVFHWREELRKVSPRDMIGRELTHTNLMGRSCDQVSHATTGIKRTIVSECCGRLHERKGAPFTGGQSLRLVRSLEVG